MKSLFNVKKHFAIFAIMATAMMLPNFAYAGNGKDDQLLGHHDVGSDGKCACGHDYFIILYKSSTKIDLDKGNKSPFSTQYYVGTAQIAMTGSSETYYGWFFSQTVDSANDTGNNAHNSFPSFELFLSEGLTTIKAGAFDGYKNLTGVTLPSTVTTIEAGAFQGCTSLTEVTIPGSCATIGNNAFQGCTNLETVTFEESNEGVTLNVGANAFNNCNSLTTVVVESENTNISSNAFSGTTNVTNVTGSVTQVENIAGGSTSGAGSTTTKPTATVVLKDNESLDPSKYVIKATGYIREGVVNAWGTLCLPFAVSSEENIVQFYQLSNVDLEKGVMEFSEMADVPANTPCVFQNLSGNTTLSFSADPVSFSAGEFVNRSAGGWSLIGTFSTIEFDVRDSSDSRVAGKNIYYISDDRFWHATGKVRIKPFRAYFEYTGVLSAAVSRLAIDVNANETGLNSVSAESESGVLYDLLGNRVDKMVKGRIYILNSKKVMFK